MANRYWHPRGIECDCRECYVDLKGTDMRRTILLLVILLTPRFCPAQIVIQPNPRALSYIIWAGQPPRAVISYLTNEEKEKLQQVYSAALQGNSALDAEADALQAQADAYRKVLIAAMVKSDPRVAPMLEKSSRTHPPDANNSQILRAQSHAMQDDPNLQSQWDDLTKKMKVHQEGVDAAMLKLDPTISRILSKLSP